MIEKTEKSIVQVQIGNAGNRVGTKFWNLLNTEHGVTPYGQFIGNDPQQIDGIGTFYSESISGRYVPRSMLIDLEAKTLNEISNGELGSLFHPDNIICSNMLTDNTFANAFNTNRPDMLASVLDTCRHEIQKCDYPTGLQFVHSMGGGTGSGFTSLFLQHIYDEISDNLLFLNVPIFPCGFGNSNQIGLNPDETFNAMLATNELIEYSNFTVFYHNEKLIDICENVILHQVKNYKFNWGDINQLIALSMSGISASMRFPGEYQADLFEQYNNLIPFPHIHFLAPSIAPIFAQKRKMYRLTNMNTLIQQLMKPRFNFADYGDFTDKKHVAHKSQILAASVMIRGHKLSCMKLQHELKDFHNANKDKFLFGSHNSFQCHLAEAVSPQHGITATALVNSTSQMKTLLDLNSNYTIMSSFAPYLDRYHSGGITKEHFQEAFDNISQLISSCDEVYKSDVNKQLTLDNGNDGDNDDSDNDYSSSKNRTGGGAGSNNKTNTPQNFLRSGDRRKTSSNRHKQFAFIIGETQNYDFDKMSRHDSNKEFKFNPEVLKIISTQPAIRADSLHIIRNAPFWQESLPNKLASGKSKALLQPIELPEASGSSKKVMQAGKTLLEPRGLDEASGSSKEVMQEGKHDDGGKPDLQGDEKRSFMPKASSHKEEPTPEKKQDMYMSAPRSFMDN